MNATLELVDALTTPLLHDLDAFARLDLAATESGVWRALSSGERATLSSALALERVRTEAAWMDARLLTMLAAALTALAEEIASNA